MINPSSPVEAIGHSIFQALARTFPVACASDEFFYFPQLRLPEPQWSAWDCFSSETVTEFVRQLSAWENELDLLSSYESDWEVHIDIALLQKLVCTLREQLSEVRSWEFQPTFYLTLACTGIAQAMESEDPAAKHERAKSLPAFLEQASQNLNRIPALFRDIGLEMVSDTRNYLAGLEKTLPELKPALTALNRFEDTLYKVSTRQDFLLPRELLERILRFHLHYEMDIPEIDHTLDQEIEEMQQILEQEAKNFVPDRLDTQHPYPLWLEALKSIPVPAVGKEGLTGLYQSEVNRLAKHCLKQGLVLPSLVSSCPVSVVSMPPFLSAIRTASSYSIPPKHPPCGGKFYILISHATDEAQQRYLREYRMTCAHETYPGHHLLDASRWSLARPLRRAVEQPIFYEGWACFAEELMRLTGYFSAPGDRLLLTKRRLMHAIRGKVDIGLQTGTMNIPTAAEYLGKMGISMGQAISLARKYALNPGYQLCYTLGLRRFLELFHRYGRDNLPNFVQSALGQGEIHFAHLEKKLQNINN
ncbi:MAG: DUF885 family protein [Dehalococcoidales bacterium]